MRVLSGSRLRLSWIVMAFVLAGGLAIGARGDGAPATERERVDRIAATVKCTTCRGLSVAESDAKAAIAAREEIRARVRAGETDEEVRAYLAGRSGRDILLIPEGRGLPALVWAVPPAALIVAMAGLTAAFRSWRRRMDVARPTTDDEALVAAALHDR